MAATLKHVPVMIDGVDVNVDDVTLSSILADMVEATAKQYGSHIRIAAKFNALMSFAWFDMAPTEKSEDSKVFKIFKTDLYAAFKLASHSNPSVPFKRICNYGRNLAAGLSPSDKPEAAPSGDGASDGDGEGAGPAPRSAMLRNIEELTALWKFNDKQGDALPEKVAAAQVHIEAALKALGLDVALIAK
jgi:hypothetical protein